MTRSLSLLLLFGTMAGLAGCETSEKPFVLTDYRYHQRGLVQACFDDSYATVADAQKVADEICRQYDRTAKVQTVQPDQCTWSAPTLVTLSCVARPGENPGPILQHGAPMRHDTPLPAW